MTKAHRTTKKVIYEKISDEKISRETPTPAAEPGAVEENLQEALEETFPASDSISPYIKPAKPKQEN